MALNARLERGLLAYYVSNLNNSKRGLRMSWQYTAAQQTFAERADEWDVLNRAAHNHILLDARFVAAALRWFGGPDVLLGMNDKSGSRGACLVRKTGTARWQTFQPAQAPIGMLLFEGTQDTEESLLEILHSLPRMALQLGVMQQDPDFISVRSVSENPLIEVLEYIRTPRLPVVGTFEQYWSSCSHNLRHNLARQRKRLAEQGHRLELVSLRTPAAVPAAIREYGRLESQGWKGREGTAIEENNAQGCFYREVLEASSASGEAVIYQLVLDGKVVASDLCLARSGMLVVLKTAYDESVRQISPALLMRQDIVRQLFEEKTIQVVEFYGRVLDWHLKWTDQVRSIYHINCFRSRSVAELRSMVKRLA
jgi:hypothetical protein